VRVAVIGSWRAKPPPGWELEYKENFQVACIHVGSIIAKNRLSLIMPRSKDEESAEFHAYKGFINRQGGIVDGIETISDHESLHASGATHILAVQQADIIIILGGTEAAYNAAVAAVKLRRRLIAIPCFGGAARSILKRYPPPKCTELALHREWAQSVDWIEQLVARLEFEIQTYPKILLIHGRSRDRNIVRNIIINTPIPGISEPVIMEEHGHGTPTIPILFERLARQVDAAIAIATPDDIGTAVLDEAGELITGHKPARKYRARQNVWLEVGWFWGTLGFEHLLLLVKGNLEVPSDFSGLRVVRYQSTPHEAEERIHSFIENLRFGRRP
jgi:hypothetical protein